MIFELDLLTQFWKENWRIMLLAAGFIAVPTGSLILILTARECYRRYQALSEGRQRLLGTLARVYAGFAGGVYLLIEVPLMTPLATARDNLTALPLALAGIAVVWLVGPSVGRCGMLLWSFVLFIWAQVQILAAGVMSFVRRTEEEREARVTRLPTRLEEHDQPQLRAA